MVRVTFSATSKSSNLAGGELTIKVPKTDITSAEPGYDVRDTIGKMNESKIGYL
jgi:hypothetical protein